MVLISWILRTKILPSGGVRNSTVERQANFRPIEVLVSYLCLGLERAKDEEHVCGIPRLGSSTEKTSNATIVLFERGGKDISDSAFDFFE